MTLQMTTRSFADSTIVECRGGILRGDTSANFHHLVKDQLTKCKQIVLDLGGVTHIDSIGLGVLGELLISAQKAGGRIRLANLTPRSTQLLCLTKLMTMFETFDRAEDAAKTFNCAGEVRVRSLL